MKVHDPARAAKDAIAAHPERPAMAILHEAPDARLIVFRLAPGQAVPVHTSTSTVILHVLTGSGLVQGAEGEIEVRPGTVITYEPLEPHGMHATTEEFTLLAVIAPRPANR